MSEAIGHMKLKATQGKEIVVRIQNRIGVLADLSRIIADKGINLLAISGSVVEDQATIRLVTDDNLRAGDALRAHRYDPHEEAAIILRVPHKPGMMRRISECLATEMIDVYHLYATADTGQADCLLVLHTDKDDHALVRLNDTIIGG